MSCSSRLLRSLSCPANPDSPSRCAANYPGAALLNCQFVFSTVISSTVNKMQGCESASFLADPDPASFLADPNPDVYLNADTDPCCM